ncbi:MAG: hypothetical protein AAF799_39405 [Myxococcota bacterium]
MLLLAERKTARGWEAVLTYDEYGQALSFFQVGRYHQFYYALTGVAVGGIVRGRVDPSEEPPPVVRGPRGLPPGLSSGVRAEIYEVYSIWAIHWLGADEILLHDWHPFLQREARYSKPGEPEETFTMEFLDAVAKLEPVAEHRLVMWMY